MFKSLLAATTVLLLASGSVDARPGGGGHGGGGGGGGGGHGGGGFGGYGGRGGFGGYGGYGGGYYGGYGGWGYGGVGLGFPYYGVYGGDYGYYPYYGGYGDSGYGAPSYATAPAAIPYSSTSNYTPAMPSMPAALSAPASPTPINASTPAQATVTVLAPKGAQIWFDDILTPAKSGDNWVYTSPKLESNKTYVLNIKARWEENGKPQSYTIPLRVEAGDNMTMNLNNLR